MRRITAAVLAQAPGRLELQELVLSDPDPDEVLVRIAYAGLCHSDLHEIDGTFDTTPPIVLGHEAAGVVVQVGSNVRDLAVGDRVVTCLSVFCGRCRACVRGLPSSCDRRTELATGRPDRLTTPAGRPVRPTAGIGAFAEMAVVHRNALVAIPPAMPLPTASILGCAVTTGIGAVVRRARVEPGSSVVVIGAGGVGLAAIQGARLAGARLIIAVDLVPEKLAASVELGATHAFDGRDPGVVAAVREVTGGGADHVIEAVGVASAVERAMAMLAPGGVATVIGMVPSDPPIRLDGNDLFFLEKTLQGSFMGSNQFVRDIPAYVGLQLQGRLQLDRLVSEVIPFEAINDGFGSLAGGRSRRVVVEIQSGEGGR
ncbi:MAG: Zn-dependent alcohol dehydrogenase [Hamadaea sp.]|uniref:Zn-dependent alcohol dehydrogenase n=1 Tax=Glycomyces artemisiae TaxID=1076443 RepID=A0A850C9F3_9ACTN|nr:Zn-dependent alcohol dehydrogenase [Glycomyces artemisiae]NUT34495.1 Zn-dependent alcohol dehydrogenase [Hamadaea sp.]